jgi:enamine deaminase RidA (YjgF/YER057c/UK114 family)
MSDVTHLNPPHLAPPLGAYSHLSRAKAGDIVHIAGQVALDASGRLVGPGDFAAQARQVFANLSIALAAVGAEFANVAKFTTYLVHSQDIERFMAVRRELFPRLFPNGAYPPNTLLVVDRLVQEQFLIEIEAVAIV